MAEQAELLAAYPGAAPLRTILRLTVRVLEAYDALVETQKLLIEKNRRPRKTCSGTEDPREGVSRNGHQIGAQFEAGQCRPEFRQALCRASSSIRIKTCGQDRRMNLNR